MSGYVWGFIAVFMIHEMEEILGLPDWIKQNIVMLQTKYPRIAKEFKYCTNRGFTAAVYEELILFIIICLFSELTCNYGPWFALLAGFLFHLVVHLVMAIIVKKFIPFVITSIVMLPPSLYILLKVINLIDFSHPKTIIGIVVTAIIAAFNIKVAHKIMSFVTKRHEKTNLS